MLGIEDAKQRDSLEDYPCRRGWGGACVRCARDREIAGRGLCRSCYGILWQRGCGRQCGQCGSPVEKYLWPHHQIALCLRCYLRLQAALTGFVGPRLAQRRSAANERKNLRLRLAGAPRRNKMVGMRGPSWAGGRNVTCDECGHDAGWRTPSLLAKHEHTYCSQKCQGKATAARLRARRGGKVVHCAVCSEEVGYKYPSQLARMPRIGWRCPAHAQGNLGSVVRCSVCSVALGYQPPSAIAREPKRGWRCSEHQGGYRRQGQEVVCVVCSTVVGYKRPCLLAAPPQRGWRCPKHVDRTRVRKEYEDERQEGQSREV
jgi:hypothetical protein